jgi:hypothetical protein
MAEKQNIPGNSTPPSTPGWVKVFFIIIAVLIVIVVVVHLMGLRFDHGAGAGLFDGLAAHPYLMQNAMKVV